MPFTLFNAPANHPALPENPTNGETFTLTCLPGTDVWRHPIPGRATDDFNGTIYATSRPLKSFKRAAVTVSGSWSVRYVQGGLTFFIPGPGVKPTADGKWPTSPKVWIKTGIEFENDTTFASVVAANPYADWSLVPWGQDSIRVELVKENGALWVYVTGEDGKKVPIREMTWVFDKEEEQGDVWVGPLVAMPLPDGSEHGGKLEVKFSDLIIEMDH